MKDRLLHFHSDSMLKLKILRHLFVVPPPDPVHVQHHRPLRVLREIMTCLPETPPGFKYLTDHFLNFLLNSSILSRYLPKKSIALNTPSRSAIPATACSSFDNCTSSFNIATSSAVQRILTYPLTAICRM